VTHGGDVFRGTVDDLLDYSRVNLRGRPFESTDLHTIVEYVLSDLEVAIDEECSRILATRAPAAIDLRLIVAVIKTITDLERIGDEAEKIGFLSARLAEGANPSNNYRELRNLARHVTSMVHRTLDAFARLDSEEALAIVKTDEEVDQEYESIYRQSITFMMEDPRSITRVMDLTWAARALERIGDHAKNICEYVIYMVHGKDIRHIRLETVEADVVGEGEVKAR